MRTLRILVAVICSLTCLSSLQAEFDITELQVNIQQTIQTVRPSVVAIQGSRSKFSGVIVSPEGHVLSAGHAVKPGSRYTVILPDGTRLRGRGKGSNPKADCALVQITEQVEDLPFAQIGDSSKVVPNQPCVSISFPGGQGTSDQPAVRFGRIVRGARPGRMIQSTALMEPGDSGGALFDLDGRVIGIHSRIGRSMTQNFEVPIDVYKEFWTELNTERSFTGNSRPVLGIEARQREDEAGITVENVVEDSVAQKSGIQVNDVITTINGDKTGTLTALRAALAKAAEKRLDKFPLQVMREEETLSLEADFTSELPPPKVELPKYDRTEFATPEPIRQLADLPKQVSELENSLDDACVAIRSEFGTDDNKTSVRIAGTLIKDSDLIVTKNSMVGTNPNASFANGSVDLEIIQRDSENDLVLLRAPQSHKDGISLDGTGKLNTSAGIFIIAPDAEGPGQVSVISAKKFESRKQMSRGFLGVVPSTFGKNEGAVLNEVRLDGAAKRAGLKVGDVVTKMNDTPIKTQFDMRTFLTKLDPNVTIIAQVLRDGEELEKAITLGAYQAPSRHAADRMSKSGRRDGFSTVILHDADLQPEACGGPVFDLTGEFIGINIARNSRVRSYALPSDVIKQFVNSQN